MTQFFARLQQTQAILIIDDCPVMRKATCRPLHQLGYQTYVASNGRQGIDLLNHNARAIVAIMMDIEMPQMNGLQATTNIRQAGFHHQRWPIIGYSSLEPDEAQDGCLKAGMNTYLQKPAKQELLQQTIKPLILRAQQLQTQSKTLTQQPSDDTQSHNPTTLKLHR